MELTVRTVNSQFMGGFTFAFVKLEAKYKTIVNDKFVQDAYLESST